MNPNLRTAADVQKTPLVILTTGGKLEGWPQCDAWAAVNHILYANTQKQAKAVNLSETDTLRLIVARLLASEAQLKNQVVLMTASTAQPKKS